MVAPPPRRRQSSRSPPRLTASFVSCACASQTCAIACFTKRSSNLIVLLHAIEKHTGAIPQVDVDLGEQRMGDFTGRMDAERRVPASRGWSRRAAIEPIIDLKDLSKSIR